MNAPDNSLIKKKSLRWFDLIKESRRKYLISKVSEFKSPHHISLKKMTRWLYYDLRHTIARLKEINAELNSYGPLIQKTYNVSKMRQFFQQAYLTFVMGLPLAEYRIYLLFIPERWKLVKEFSYKHYESQMLIVENSFPAEKEVLDNKFKFYKHCHSLNITTPETFGIFINGGNIISKNSLPKQDIFIKELRGQKGRGAVKYSYDQNEGLYYCKSSDKKISPALLFDLLAEQSTHMNLIVQPALKNHPEWKNYTSGALATCRIITARSPYHHNKIIPLAATLRMPVGNTDVDNVSMGGIACPTNLENGKLGPGITKIPYKETFEFIMHPDTGYKFIGTTLPYWKELFDYTSQVHRNFQTIFVGWDIALTEDGFSVIEGNKGWGIESVESPQLIPFSQTRYPELYEAWLSKIAEFKL